MASHTTATQDCLRVSEISLVIIGFLRPTDLARLVRTCRAMYEGGRPTLWKAQRSLRPLLRLLPPDAWSEDLDERGSSIFRITDPEKIEWTRFDSFAQHVRTFCWDDVNEVSPDTLSVLSGRGRPLFPRLRWLSLTDRTGKIGLPSIHLFLVPTIDHLVLSLISFNAEVAIMCQTFQRVGATCTNLAFLELWQEEIKDVDGNSDDIPTPPQQLTDDINDALAVLLGGLPKLENFRASAISISASCVEALAALPSVVQVDTHLIPPDMHTVAAAAARSSREGRPWFNALGELALGVNEMDRSTATFLRAIRSKALECLVIECFIQPDSYTVKHNLEVVARRPSLRTLMMGLGHVPEDSSRVYETLDVEDALQPLYALPSLHTVDIRCASLVVSANAVRDIANAWRELSTLELLSLMLPHGGVEKPSLTLEDLIPLAVNCPELRALGLPLNAEEVPDGATLERLLPAPSRSPLFAFTACYAPIENPGQVAHFLARLFPKLRAAVYRDTAAKSLPYETKKGTFWGKWKIVHNLLAPPPPPPPGPDQAFE
ncbi:hypothetical protein TRAPUB_9993 [Trametes pubescens]|uniref:F-box domain-containing protein n=1 Tax=Trametes pubescens TaxID=154538 RepID=A0A1M2W0Z3_TRAPU|nr:hypothetical protein TRAPUB_9993 [Trametes pubescens]